MGIASTFCKAWKEVLYPKPMPVILLLTMNIICNVLPVMHSTVTIKRIIPTAVVKLVPTKYGEGMLQELPVDNEWTFCKIKIWE